MHCEWRGPEAGYGRRKGRQRQRDGFFRVVPHLFFPTSCLALRSRELPPLGALNKLFLVG